MKTRWFKIALAALAVIAVVEGGLLLGLHRPYPAKGKLPEPEEFMVLDQLPPSQPGAGQPIYPGGGGTAVGWDPFAEIGRMRQEMDAMLEQARAQLQSGASRGNATMFTFSNRDTVAAMEIVEEEDHYRCTLDMAGADENSIHIIVEGDLLSVKGSRTVEQNHEQQGRIVARLQHTEHFTRSVHVPGPVEAATLQTRYEDGVLTILLPKAATPGASPLPQ
jgi:HSP20 family protein